MAARGTRRSGGKRPRLAARSKDDGVSRNGNPASGRAAARPSRIPWAPAPGVRGRRRRVPPRTAIRGRVAPKAGHAGGPVYRQRTTEDRSSSAAWPRLPHSSLFFLRLAGRPVSGTPRRGTMASARARACRLDALACRRPSDRTGSEHEPTTQPAIPRWRQSRPPPRATAPRKPARALRPRSAGERCRRQGCSRLPCRHPGRRPRLDAGRGPTHDLASGGRRARSMTRGRPMEDAAGTG